MIIRQEQTEVFAAAAREKFTEEAVAHVRGFSPKHTEVLGDDGTRRVVRLGIQRAGMYGFAAPGPVHLFLDLMFVLGSEFDEDPQYPWASQVLNDPDIPGPMPRADLLHARSMQYFEAVGGTDNAFAMQALRNLKAFEPSSLSGARDQLPQRTAAALHAIYPQKAGYTGEAGLHALIERGSARARAFGITSETGGLLFIALEFMLGHAFERDPLYPWIASTLTNANEAGPEDRARSLHQKTRIYLDRALEHLEQSQHGEV